MPAKERALVNMDLLVPDATGPGEEWEIYNVVKPSAEVIAGVMLASRRRSQHPAYKWQKDSRSEHLAHAHAHMRNILEADNIGMEPNDEDLSHALCRLAMAMATYNQT